MGEATQLEISTNDTMYEGSLAHYVSVGQSALHCVRVAMDAAEKSTVRNILDFGCGFGRVLRVLKAAFPAASLTACDVSRQAIEFCKKTFGATPVLSCESSDEIRFKESFDLIWCGTVLTQFDAPQFLAFLKLFHSLLSADGLVVFTTHGPFVAHRLRTGDATYGLVKESVSAMLAGYDATGFGYGDYPREVLPQVGVSKYGVCISKPEWVCRQIESLLKARLITYTERAWDKHQDSVAFMKQ